jgi:hypothetical protein
MRNLSPGLRLRCLSCGEEPARGPSGAARVRSRAGRFAFAPCPRCRCLRMMAVDAGVRDRELAAGAEAR